MVETGTILLHFLQYQIHGRHLRFCLDCSRAANHGTVVYVGRICATAGCNMHALSVKGTNSKQKLNGEQGFFQAHHIKRRGYVVHQLHQLICCQQYSLVSSAVAGDCLSYATLASKSHPASFAAQLQAV